MIRGKINLHLRVIISRSQPAIFRFIHALTLTCKIQNAINFYSKDSTAKYDSECVTYRDFSDFSSHFHSVNNVLRCEVHSLLFGILTALPTGAASAIAVLGENSGPVVGVAISVSLLPPAVNAVSTGHTNALNS